MASFTRSDDQAWRALAQAAGDPHTAPEALLARVKATAGRAIPCDRRREHSAFVALQALARAAADGPRARRARLAESLTTLAADCAHAAGWSLDRPAAMRLGDAAPCPDLFAA